MEKEPKKITTDELREIVREIINSNEEIKEYDLLVKKQREWEQEKEELKKGMKEMLSNIENDNYQQSVNQIDDVISKLKIWKSKIEKHL